MPLPPRELVVQLLRYDRRTGDLIWQNRPREMFNSDGDWKKWNTRYAGKIAGHALKGRRVTAINNTLHYCHRLIWLIVYGEPVPNEIDHKDTNGLNNRIDNLRAATDGQNNANRQRSPKNTSGYKGVSWNGWSFIAQIQHERKNIYLGSFATPQEAHVAYCEAADRLYGEFARHS